MVFLSARGLDVKASDRLRAWTRVLEAVADIRDSLQYRISREDVTDTQLESDVQKFGELTRALADYLQAKKEVHLPTRRAA
jgi:hypothetical protein